MYLRKLMVFALLVLVVAAFGCGSKDTGAKQLQGKWAFSMADTMDKNPELKAMVEQTPQLKEMFDKFEKEFVIEITSDTLKMANPSATAALEYKYTVKSDDGKTVVLQMKANNSDRQDEATFTIDGDKMTMSDSTTQGALSFARVK